MRRTPALIVGGGPAGAAAALVLSRAGLPHLLVERTNAPGDALCGGFLSWRTLDLLERLGIDRPVLNRSTIQCVRLFAGKRIAEASLPRPALGVSRRHLDTLMRQRAVNAGAAIETGVTVRSIEPDGSAQLADGNTISGDALFLATGKHELRGLARPAEARGGDPTLGLRVRLAAGPALTRLIGDAVELHLFDRGYAGLALQEDGSANLCLAVHRSRLQAAGSPDALLVALGNELPSLGDRLAHRDGTEAVDAIANVPYGWRATTGIAGLFRLGDQAAVIPSLAGEGIGIALASGVRAAQAYSQGGQGAASTYQRGLAADLARPLMLAGAILAAAEHRASAAALVALARLAPSLAGLAARLTRIRQPSLDAAAPGRDGIRPWNI